MWAGIEARVWNAKARRYVLRRCCSSFTALQLAVRLRLLLKFLVSSAGTILKNLQVIDPFDDCETVWTKLFGKLRHYVELMRRVRSCSSRIRNFRSHFKTKSNDLFAGGCAFNYFETRDSSMHSVWKRKRNDWTGLQKEILTRGFMHINNPPGRRTLNSGKFSAKSKEIWEIWSNF